MIDIKKLVTGFLILAALASSSAFIFSNFAPSSATTQNSAVILDNQGDSAPQMPANALVEPLPEYQPYTNMDGGQTADNSGTGRPTDDGLPPVVPTTNLTTNLTQMALREFVKENPQGPQADGSGLGLVQPDPNSIIEEVIKNSGDGKLAVPDWDAEVSAQKFSVISNASPADEEKYKAAMLDIYNENLGQNRLATLTKSDPAAIIDAAKNNLSPLVSEFSPAIDRMLDESKTIPVPERFAALHQSAITLIVYGKNLLALAKNATDDPMRTYLVAQAEGKKYQDALARFKTELQKTAAFSDATPTKMEKFLSLLGLQTAHAQYVDVFQAGWQPFAWTWSWLLSIITQILKNVIIKTMENQVLNWVRGGGTPLFITHWRQFLENSFKLIAGTVIGQILPGLCGRFQAGINANLRNSMTKNFTLKTCTVDQIVSNLKGFYGGFRNGGWMAYGATSLPSGNYFGSIYISNNIVAHQAGKAKDAHKNEGIASKGFLSMKACPNGTTKVEAGGAAICINDANGDTSEPINTTPGASVGNVVDQALAGKDLIENANDWTGILAAFLGSLVDAFIARGMTLL